jgi:hypothetical protein
MNAIVHMDIKEKNVKTSLTGAHRVHVKTEQHAFNKRMSSGAIAHPAGLEKCVT